MASLDVTESMDEDFTGFDEEPVLVNSGGTALFPERLAQIEKLEEALNETDSDSGNLVIAEPNKKSESNKSTSEKSPRKRKSRAEDITPTRTPSSRVRGQGLAYLLAMEKGGSKKQLAKAQAAQAQAENFEIPPATPTSEPPAVSQPETPVENEAEKKKAPKETVKTPKEKEVAKVLKEKETPSTPVSETTTPVVSKQSKSSSRKSHSAINISSPLLKEPFKEGKTLLFFFFLNEKSFSSSHNYLVSRLEKRSCIPSDSRSRHQNSLRCLLLRTRWKEIEIGTRSV